MSGMYANYSMIPAEHIKRAEELLTEAEREYLGFILSGKQGYYTVTPPKMTLALLHVEIAQAQMQGAGRA